MDISLGGVHIFLLTIWITGNGTGRIKRMRFYREFSVREMGLKIEIKQCAVKIFSKNF